MKADSLTEDALKMKKEKIILVAAQLFLRNGIDAVRMTDIADASGVGVASLYRYFQTRTAIVIEAGTILWEEVRKDFIDYFAPSGRRKTGLKMVAEQFDYMLRMYHERPDFVRFLDSFDRLVLTERIPPDELAGYEDSIVDLKALFMETCKKGVKDGSIRPGLKYEKLYLATAHAMNALAEKAARGPILKGDDFSSIDEEASEIRDLLLYYLQT